MQKMTQQEIRQSVDVDSALGVSPVTWWYRHGHFQNEEQARGAFELAYQQAMDGMGVSIAKWMGLTEDELYNWMKTHTLPPKRKARKSKRS